MRRQFKTKKGGGLNTDWVINLTLRSTCSSVFVFKKERPRKSGIDYGDILYLTLRCGYGQGKKMSVRGAICTQTPAISKKGAQHPTRGLQNWHSVFISRLE